MTFFDSVVLLIGQATRNGMYHYDFGATRGVFDPKAYVDDAKPGTYVCVNDDTVWLASEPAMLLEQLHASVSEGERRVFAEILVPRVTFENARVVARTLVATGHSNSLFAVGSTDRVEQEFWRGLVHTLRFEPQLFSESDLNHVERAAEHCRDQQRTRAVEEARQQAREDDAFPIRSGLSGPRSYSIGQVYLDPVVIELKAVVARVRYLRVARAIRENRNPTAEVDRQVLLSRLQALGFSKALGDASNEIERRAAVATSDTDFKTVMDLVRTFLEEFVEEASRKIESRVGRSAPSADKANHYQPYREYLEGAGIIGRNESALLQPLYNFLSNEGAHKLSSAPEQLQVARVIVIECCLLIAGRVQAFLAQTGSRG